MNTYGLSTCIAADLPRAEALATIAGAGFRDVELVFGEGPVADWMTDPAGMRSDLAAAGLRAWSVHSPGSGWDLAAPDEPTRLAAIDAAKASFRPAAEVGAELVVCHCNAPVRPFTPDDYRPSLDRTRASLTALAEAAGEAGVRLAVENMVLRVGQRPGTRVAELLELIDGLGDHVGICLDTGHAHASGADPAAEAIQAGGKLFSLHLQDNHGRRNEDEHLVPGRGTIDWDAVLDALDRLRFTRPRILEIALKNAQTTLAETLAELAALRRRWQARA